jgi:DNA-directed RNA polymerase specialized sigma24 family protein
VPSSPAGLLAIAGWTGELSQADAAARLGWSAGRVKGRLERGRVAVLKRV